jgi:hypothetical protein
LQAKSEIFLSGIAPDNYPVNGFQSRSPRITKHGSTNFPPASQTLHQACQPRSDRVFPGANRLQAYV